MQSSICAICGKSSFEPVAPRAAVRVDEKWWATLENHELRKIAISVGGLVVIAAVVAFVLTRPTAEPTATELPPPAPIVSAPPDLHVDGRAPSIAESIRPPVVVAPGVPREVGTGLSPWESAPPVDFVTGLLLDARVDYTADIARVQELLGLVPPQWSFAPLDPPELAMFGGTLDAGVVEGDQPFAARTMRREADGVELGELWLVASAGTEEGDAYVAAARARWDVAAAIDQFSPEVGVRLFRLAGNADANLWAADLEPASMIIIQAPVGVAPNELTAVLHGWRRAIAAG